MITQLTAEQEKMMEVYRNKWIKIGLSTEPTNQERARSHIPAYYAAGGLQPPEYVLFAKSPAHAVAIVNKLGSDDFCKTVSTLPQSQQKALIEAVPDSVGYDLSNIYTNVLSDYTGGNLWAGWLAFYEYFKEVVGVAGLDKCLPSINLAQDVGWIFPYENVCILTEKPAEIHLNTSGRLHNTAGMAIKWPDGFGLYSLNGVTVPDWLVLVPAEHLDVSKVMGISNAEVRLEGIRKLGAGRMLENLDAKVIDTKGAPENPEYRLYEVVLEGQQNKLLEMQNPSEPKKHYEWVPPEIMSVTKALAWRIGWDSFKEPVAKT